MSLEELYGIFRQWLNPNAKTWELMLDAPKEAKDAYEEYLKIKNDSKGRIVE